MSQQNINYSNPDDGLGDKLRNAFIKVDNNFTQLFNGKVDKIAGKGLSENDFTDADKSKLDGIEAGAQVNVNADFGENDPLAPGYILNKPPAMYASVGYFDHNDTATQTTPLVLVSGTKKKLTNDALGAFTDLSQAPYGVPNVWNATNNQFDFSDLSIGDTIDLRVDTSLTTTGTNKTYKIYLKLGVDTQSEFTTLVGSGELKAAVTDENIVHEVSFYIGNKYVRDAPAELYLLLDTSGSVKVNGWYTRVIRKGLNVIDIKEGALLKDPTTYSPATLPLTGTEVALLNDGTNWVKITWNNIKAQLASVFQAILVSGTNIKTINGTSILGSGNLVVSGGSRGDDFLLDGLTFPAQRYNTINVWRSPFPSSQAVDSNSLASYGTGTAPNASFNTQAFWLSVPDGYIIDKIELNINYKLESSINSTLQVYVLKSEVNYSYIGTAVFNEQVLANESVVLSAGAQFLKYCKNLTVASNSLPTLNKMHLRFAVRETQATDVYYSLNFKVKFKKA